MAQSNPFFSVIIPCYNRGDTLSNLLNSIFNQRHTDFELVIVDDGSTDNTREVVKQFNDTRLIYTYQDNGERGAARNFGASMSRGLYLNFFDSDDIMYPDHLQVAAGFIRGQNQCRFLHTGYNIVGELGQILSTEMGVLRRPEDRLITTNYLACNSVFIERSLFLSTKFNPDRRLASSEDWELWLRVISRVPLHCCAKVTFELRNHPGRSLFTISPDKVIERDMVMLESLMADEAFVKKFARKLRIFEADRYTFFSLCLVEANRSRGSFHFLYKSLKATPAVIVRRRFWACCKHLLLSLGKQSERQVGQRT